MKRGRAVSRSRPERLGWPLSTSDSELNRPNEKRRAPRARLSFTFIARSTWDASIEPVLQAEPAENRSLVDPTTSERLVISLPRKKCLTYCPIGVQQRH